MQLYRGPMGETVTIGVIGPRDLVQRILLLQDGPEPRHWRLIGAAHTSERQTYDQVTKIAGSVDAILFTGPLQYDLARQAGDLIVPATYVPISGASLYSSIIRGLMAGSLDPSRVSIDSIGNDDVEAAYQDIEVSTEHVHTREYHGAESVAEFVEFHRELYEGGATSAALTTVKSVAERLTRAGVPALRMVPASTSIRIALNTAALLGAGSILGDAQIVVVVVQVSPASRPVTSGPPNYHHLELTLTLHQLLLGEVGDLGASLVQRDAATFVVTATRGSLSQLAHRLQVPRFIDRLRAETGLTVDIGVGIGETPRASEEQAYSALEHARRSDSTQVFLVRPDGSAVPLPGAVGAAEDQADSQPASGSWKATETLRRIVEVLPHQPGEPLVVDAETVAEGLEVTPRSARRILASLVDAGLAWPMSAGQSSKAGRPRQQFRLIAG